MNNEIAKYLKVLVDQNGIALCDDPKQESRKAVSNILTMSQITFILPASYEQWFDVEHMTTRYTGRRHRWENATTALKKWLKNTM